MTTNSNTRLHQIDILRFIAVFFVIIFHAQPIPSNSYVFLTGFWNFFHTIGWIGVDLFFVLSGFLVSGLIFNEYKKKKTFEAGRFLIRRGFKIYPPFWLLIISTILYQLFTGQKIIFSKIVSELLFIQNYLRNSETYLWGHTWSLAIEEHFYIGLTILCFGLIKFTVKKFDFIPTIFILITLFCLSLRFFFLFSHLDRPTFYSTYYYTHFRIDSLFFGVLIAYFWHFKDWSNNKFITKYRNYFLIIGILLYLPFGFFDRDSTGWMLLVGYNILAVGSGCLLIFALKTEYFSGNISKILAKIGSYSYSIYLWHLPVKEIITPRVVKFLSIENWFFETGFYITLSILLGIILAELIEIPVLKLRDKYFPSKTRIMLESANK